jgi:hypothetical protein
MLQGRRCCRKILFKCTYVSHLLLTDDVNPYSIGFHIPSFRIPENTQVMPVLVVPGTTLATQRRQLHITTTTQRDDGTKHTTTKTLPKPYLFVFEKRHSRLAHCLYKPSIVVAILLPLLLNNNDLHKASNIRLSSPHRRCNASIIRLRPE